MHSFLEIKSLVLPVYIGRTKKERQKTQDISFHITLGFMQAPKDEKTDQLKNSVCYFKVCEKIRQLTSQNTFSLIEKLAFETLTIIKKDLPSHICVRICVHKIKAPVPYLKGGVSYTCGDL
ncbi:MAG: dihydroneopterin aldolase [Oligoflexia bacterium]|nr:dihydroneopterin aldolase [Oligoflexia bacterium]